MEPERLTTTEARVAGLVAGGRTNREIAATLGVPPGAIARHLAGVYRKLGVRSRTELALLLDTGNNREEAILPDGRLQDSIEDSDRRRSSTCLKVSYGCAPTTR
jgi:DNA-binding CsgD family transcriptional regulator